MSDGTCIGCDALIPGEGGLHRRAEAAGWARLYRKGQGTVFRCPACTPPERSPRDPDAPRAVLVRLTPYLHAAIKETARLNDRSMAQEIRHAIRQHLDAHLAGRE